MSGSDRPTSSQPILLRSDVPGHDIITCKVRAGACDNDVGAWHWFTPDCPMCAGRAPERQEYWPSVAVEIYVTAAGYKHLHAQGRVVSGDQTYIWMEVSK
jgi:hypothetical protein